MKRLLITLGVCICFSINSFAKTIILKNNETKIIKRIELVDGIRFYCDTLIMMEGSKLLLEEDVEHINIFVKYLYAYKNSVLDFSNKKTGKVGSTGNDNSHIQAGYCKTGCHGGAGSKGGNGFNGVDIRFYANIHSVNGLTIRSNGSDGGQGGNGGRGGRGGGRKNSRGCNEGVGGWGGTGGSGGRGGNSGSIYFRWKNVNPNVMWTSANKLPTGLQIDQIPGNGGKAGVGGPGGPGNKTGSTGHSGSKGSNGNEGSLIVERVPSEFDNGLYYRIN